MNTTHTFVEHLKDWGVSRYYYVAGSLVPDVPKAVRSFEIESQN